MENMSRKMLDIPIPFLVPYYIIFVPCTCKFGGDFFIIYKILLLKN